MATDKEKAMFEKAVGYVNKWLQVVDAVDDGLMKTHEAVGYVRDKAISVLDTAQDGVFALSGYLEKYREYVYQNIMEQEEALYGTASSGPVEDGAQAVVDIEAETAKMSGSEKVAFLVEELGMPATKFANWDEATVTNTVHLLKFRKLNKQ